MWGSHKWRPSAHVRRANSAVAPAPPCGPAGPCTTSATTATAPTPRPRGRRTSGSLTETRVRDWQDWPERFDGSADRHMRASPPAVHRAGAALAVDRRSSTPAWTRRPRGLPRRRGLGTDRANRPSGQLPQTQRGPREKRARWPRDSEWLEYTHALAHTGRHRRCAAGHGARAVARHRPLGALLRHQRSGVEPRPVTARPAVQRSPYQGQGACSEWPVWTRERPSPESGPVTSPPRGRPRAGDLSRPGELWGPR